MWHHILTRCAQATTTGRLVARAATGAMAGAAALWGSSNARCGAGGGEEVKAKFNRSHYPRGPNAKFLEWSDSKLLDVFAGKGGRFEDPELREIAKEKDNILAALGNLRGLSVADLGAGTGLMVEALSQRVGSDGTVFAVELSDAFQRHLTRVVRDKGLVNAHVVQCDDKSTYLVPESTDLALMCDVYHHLEYPHTYMRDVQRSLKEGGRFVILDYYNDPARAKHHSPKWMADHIRAGKDDFRREIEGAGFRYVCDVVIEDLTENYMMVFEKAGGR